MAALFGLASALLWGATDFLIRVAGRAAGVHRAMFYAQGFSAVAVSAWLAASPATRRPLLEAPRSAIVGAVLAAVPGLLATLTLYRGMQVGPVGVVAPIIGAYGVVTALLSAVTGETLTTAAVAGIGVTVAGGLLVSRPAPDSGEAARARRGAGLRWALLSCACFGVQFWAQGHYAAPDLGAVIPVWIYYCLSTVVLATAALIRRPSLTLTRGEAATVFGTGGLAVGGYLALSAGLATGHVAVATVLSSLSSAITVGLACLFVGERLRLPQWAGVAMIVLGLGLLNAGS